MARKSRKGMIESVSEGAFKTVQGMSENAIGISKAASRAATAMLPKGRK